MPPSRDQADPAGPAAVPAASKNRRRGLGAGLPPRAIAPKRNSSSGPARRSIPESIPEQCPPQTPRGSHLGNPRTPHGGPDPARHRPATGRQHVRPDSPRYRHRLFQERQPKRVTFPISVCRRSADGIPVRTPPGPGPEPGGKAGRTRQRLLSGSGRPTKGSGHAPAFGMLLDSRPADRRCPMECRSGMPLAASPEVDDTMENKACIPPRRP